MRYLSKLLGASGLVIMTGPLCLLATAQSYIDVEAERAAAASGGSTAPASSSGSSTTGSSGANGQPAATDPYAVQPASPYSTSSAYSPSTTPPVSSVPAGGTAPGGQNLGNLFLQIQQLQQEVMRLNGKVEEQAHELRMLKEQSLQRYVDLDKRIGAGGAPAASGEPQSTSATPKPAPAAAAPGSSVPEEPGEGDAYRAAFALVTGQEFDRAVSAFQQFLMDYPSGKYAPNAHYWLGELYLVIDPPDLESSRQSFTLLLSEYPDTSKAPDAMYKLGKVYFDKGNREKAREYMDRVVRDYGNTNSSAVKLARDFIAENY